MKADPRSAASEAEVRPDRASRLPLAGERVLDLTRLLPGAFCSQMLAELGAEVIKIEQPGIGDYWRDEEPLVGGQGARYAALNRMKKSLALDLAKPAGKEAFLRLVRQSHLVLEGFRPGVMKRLGLDWPVLRDRNPRLIMISLSSFGQEGPLSHTAAHDLNILGLSGALELSGDRDAEPAVPGLPLGDVGGGSLLAFAGALVAMRQRDSAGEGQYLDVSMLDGLAYWLAPNYLQSLGWGRNPERGVDPIIGGAAWYRAYRTACGGAMVVGAYEAKFWKTFCECMGVPELVERQYGDAETQRAMMRTLEVIFLTRTRDEWTAHFEGCDCCVTPSLGLLEAMSSPHAKARGLVVGDAGALGVHIRNPIRIGQDDAKAAARPPHLGEHTEEVLSSFGFDESEMESLRRAGVI